jgi:hypothetical protein
MINRKQINHLEPPLFKLGKVVATRPVVLALAEAHQSADSFLGRHVTGDWGEVDKRDERLNNLALKNECRIFSVYTLLTGKKIWIVTEADRSVTTVLLPQDY